MEIRRAKNKQIHVEEGGHESPLFLNDLENVTFPRPGNSQKV
jgi:hypothetical protein